MEVRIREPLFVKVGEIFYTVRQGTSGVESKGVVYFHDVTRTVAVGCSKQYCVESPHTFVVSRTLEDKEISFKEICGVINDDPTLTKAQKIDLMDNINIL